MTVSGQCYILFVCVLIGSAIWWSGRRWI